MAVWVGGTSGVERGRRRKRGLEDVRRDGDGENGETVRRARSAGVATIGHFRIALPLSITVLAQAPLPSRARLALSSYLPPSFPTPPHHLLPLMTGNILNQRKIAVLGSRSVG